MKKYAIVEEGTVFYLNHSTLSTLSFGSFDMAWTTDNIYEAEHMLQKVIDKHSGQYKVIEIYSSST